MLFLLAVRAPALAPPKVVKVYPLQTAESIIITDPPEAMIHGPRTVGASPGKLFLFLIPATGEGPLVFSADYFPAGLALDARTGILSGRIQNVGTTNVLLQVNGAKGRAFRNLVIVCGPGRLALTPPMGWNSWHAFGPSVNDEKVRAAAFWMAKSGLAAHGYQYINIDDGWMIGRDTSGRILPNPEKFPDMKALADYVHSLGLKIGIYSSPGPKTCRGLPGSLNHELQDAETFSQWGIDYIKYDWCSYTTPAIKAAKYTRPPHLFYQDHLFVHFYIPLEELIKPYTKMRDALDGIDRDIVYSIVPMTLKHDLNAAHWARRTGANLWRTSGDIRDNWKSVSRVGFGQRDYAAMSSPGGWNDPDMLVVGMVSMDRELHATPLTRDEQITHFSLWSMLAAPLLLGCDLSRLDDFTLALVTNDEVIEVDQDPLGKAATLRKKSGEIEVWARPLWDETMAVALFNRSGQTAKVTAEWKNLGLEGSHPVRDLWRKKDLGVFEGSITAEVPAHGAVLFKIGKP